MSKIQSQSLSIDVVLVGRTGRNLVRVRNVVVAAIFAVYDSGRLGRVGIREVSTWRFREQIARSKKTPALQAIRGRMRLHEANKFVALNDDRKGNFGTFRESDLKCPGDTQPLRVLGLASKSIHLNFGLIWPGCNLLF